MKKRDKKKENREIVNALAMLLQIGLAMMTCMAMSFGIGFYLDRLLGTRYWIIIFLLIGIMASIRSLFILVGKIQPTSASRQTGMDVGDHTKEEANEGGKKDTD